MSTRTSKQIIKIGLWTIVSVAILYIGIYYLKGLSLFGTSSTYYVSMSNVNGLKVATRIYINGYKVGSIQSIKYDYHSNGNPILVLSIDRNVRIPRGAQVSFTQTLMAGRSINLELPDQPTSDFYSPHDTLPVSATADILSTERLQSEILPQIIEIVPKVSQMVCRIDSTVGYLNQLITNPSIPPIIADIRHTTSSLRTSAQQIEGALGALPAIMNQINASTHSVQQFTTQLDSVQLAQILQDLGRTSAELKQFSAKLNTPGNSVDRLIHDDRLYQQVDSVTTSLDRLIRDIQQNPKRYVKLSLF